MHNEVWDCAEILLASFPCATASFKILEFFSIFSNKMIFNGYYLS